MLTLLSRMSVVLPVVDCSPCSPDVDFDPNSEENIKLTKELHRAFTEVGFAYIINHGISNKEMSKMWEMSDDFFNLPRDVKMKAMRVPGGGVLGWTPYGAEIITGKGCEDGSQGDFKETYDFSPARAELDTVKTNQKLAEWPGDDVLPGFLESHEQFFDRLKKLSMNFLNLFGSALDLKDPQYIVNLHSKIGQPGNMTNLRFLKYPPVQEDVTKGQRLGEHVDYGCLTIMMQKDVGGLELQTQAGEWVYVEPKVGMFILIPCEEMECLTSGKYKGNLHRASLPALHEGTRHLTRRSAAFFCHPDNDILIVPIDGSTKYKPRKHGDLIAERYTANYK